MLFTSGTTSKPKAVELTHNNLTSYITGTVEFASADPGDAALICVPPYHIAGPQRRAVEPVCRPKDGVPHELRRHRVGASGRHRERHVGDGGADDARPHRQRAGRRQGHAAVAAHARLRRLEGGAAAGAQGAVAAAGCRLRQRLRPHRNQLHHRRAHPRRSPRRARRDRRRGDPAARLGGPTGAGHRGRRSAPRTAPFSARARPASCSSAASRCRAATPTSARCSTPQGWFPTKDVASLDDEGYLFIGGRSDDTIIRGGENIAPAEIEDVLVEHPHVRDCAVVGAEDPEWGQIIVAVVVARRRAPRPTPTTCARTCAPNCADPAPPTGSCSATNCPPTRRARCCAANCVDELNAQPTKEPA